MSEILEEKANKIKFDGGEKPGNDRYVARCEENAINLDINKLGDYAECAGCRKQRECRLIAAEQAALG